MGSTTMEVPEDETSFMATAITLLIGREVDVRLADDSAYCGILHDFTAGHGFVLRDARMSKACDGKSDETNGEPIAMLEVLMKDFVDIVDVQAESEYTRTTGSKLNRDAREYFPAHMKPARENLMVGPGMAGTGFMQNNYRQVPHGSYSPAPMMHLPYGNFAAGNFGSAHSVPQIIPGSVVSMMQPNGFTGQFYGAQTRPYLPMNAQPVMNHSAPGIGPYYSAPQPVRFPYYQGYFQGQQMQPLYSVPHPLLARGLPLYTMPRHFPAYQQFQAPESNGFINGNFR